MDKNTYHELSNRIQKVTREKEEKEEEVEKWKAEFNELKELFDNLNRDIDEKSEKSQESLIRENRFLSEEIARLRLENDEILSDTKLKSLTDLENRKKELENLVQSLEKDLKNEKYKYEALELKSNLNKYNNMEMNLGFEQREEKGDTEEIKDFSDYPSSVRTYVEKAYKFSEENKLLKADNERMAEVLFDKERKLTSLEKEIEALNQKLNYFKEKVPYAQFKDIKLQLNELTDQLEEISSSPNERTLYSDLNRFLAALQIISTQYKALIKRNVVVPKFNEINLDEIQRLKEEDERKARADSLKEKAQIPSKDYFSESDTDGSDNSS